MTRDLWLILTIALTAFVALEYLAIVYLAMHL